MSHKCSYNITSLIKHPPASIHVLPAFERVNEGNFNCRVKLFNEEIKAFCAKDHNYEYIENRIIFSHDKMYFSRMVFTSLSPEKNV